MLNSQKPETSHQTRGGALRVAALMIGIATLAVFLTACGGDDSSTDPDQIDTGPAVIGPAGDFTPTIVNSELTVGDDRLALGLLDTDLQPVTTADLNFRVFQIKEDQGIVVAEVHATPIQVVKSYTDRHEDGTVETHAVGQIGVYVAHVDFTEAGDYGVEVSGTVDDAELDPMQVRFNVLEESPTIEVGEMAPASKQQLLSDVDDISEIDTADPPIPEMHEQTIADAVTSGRPTVLILGTPAFCTSQICGPVKQAVDEVYEQYKDQANFIHVEPYDVAKARSGEALELVPFLKDEWHLANEPWVYVIDSDGIVSARFEGPVAADEIRQALLDDL